MIHAAFLQLQRFEIWLHLMQIWSWRADKSRMVPGQANMANSLRRFNTECYTWLETTWQTMSVKSCVILMKQTYPFLSQFLCSIYLTHPLSICKISAIVRIVNQRSARIRLQIFSIFFRHCIRGRATRANTIFNTYIYIYCHLGNA